MDSEGQFHFARDADGHVNGGLRLPHMPTLLPNGGQAGAPLGVYRGLDPDYKDHFNYYAWIAGSFDRSRPRSSGALSEP